MEKRFIIFLLLSLAVIQITMLYIGKTHPPPPPIEKTSAPTPAGQSAETPPRAEPTPAPSAPEVVDRAAIPTLPLLTDVYAIEFSPVGAVPLRWDIIDPRFVQRPNGSKPSDVPSTHTEPLIDPAIAAHSELDPPFSVILKESNDRYYNEFNTGRYEYSRIEQEGRLAGYEFRSPPSPTGIQLIKTYRFDDPASFTSNFEIRIENHGPSRINFNREEMGLGIVLGPGLGPAPEDIGGISTPMRFAMVDPILKSSGRFDYKHFKPEDPPVSFDGVEYDWGGLQSTYFLAAILPDVEMGTRLAAARMMLDQDVLKTVATAKNSARFYPSIEIYTKPLTIDPGKSLTLNYHVFIGPKQHHILEEAGHDLDRVLFHDSYAWMRALCLALMSMLSWFHSLVGNWGVSIILLTITIRLLIFPLVQKGMKAQAKSSQEMMKLKPLIDKLNEKYKNDPQRKQQEIFKLYREHGINPLGMLKGCLWLLIQIPIFIALYKLLLQSIDLRGADFLWVRDLSQADRLFTFPFPIPFLGDSFNLLPLLTGVTQMLTSKYMTTPPTDPQQAQMQKMMIYIMPFFILFITYSFPAGVMLYWLVSSLWQVLQQLWVNKHIKKPQQAAAAVASKARA